MDTPIELLTQALLGELPEERKRCFEAWLQESEGTSFTLGKVSSARIF